MTRSRIINITRIWMMLSFTAVTADLFYIIHRLHCPALTFDDAAFVHAVPEMFTLMLLSVAVIAAFMAVMAQIIKNE